MCGRELLYKHNGRRKDGRSAATVVLLCVCAVGAVLGGVWLWHVTATHFHSVRLSVNTDKLLHLVDRESRRLVKLTSMLAPAYFRVGGTLADLLLFEPDASTNWSEQVPDLPDWQMCAYAEPRKPNAFRHVFGVNISGSMLGHDFVTLRHLLNSFPRYRKSKLVGPDVTRPIKRNRLTVPPVKYMEEFLEVANRSIDAVAWHQYYLNGRKAKLSDFVKPSVLDILGWQIASVQFAMSGTSLPMWITETASAYGGGARELSDRFVAGFMWMDKLGLAARMGVSVVDWWLSVLYKQLVGRGVLEVLGAPEHVRVYCHCAQEPNAIVLFGMNLATLPSVISVMGVPASSRVLEYVLTYDRILTSEHVLLNGKKLELNPDASLPPFEPVITSLSDSLVIPPFSMVFWVIQDINVPVCAAHD
ncbi:hypothetical protein C0J52_10518 [Blattella germanica]|nr:hypothetical protein C0J52_10518 [Blattella germanica]